jgi:hypothetical protein
MAPGWIQAQPEIFDLHIHRSMVRLQIENASFFFRNLQNLSPERVAKLTDLSSLKPLKGILTQTEFPKQSLCCPNVDSAEPRNSEEFARQIF